MKKSSRQEKKGVLQALRDQFRSKKASPETRAFYDAVADHAKQSAGMESSQSKIREAFVKMAKVEFPNLKAEKVFDRMAFYAAHEDEFGKDKRPEVKDYPAENISAKEVEDMNVTYNFSQTYEKNGIYEELGSQEKVDGYRTALMGTGQIAGYCADEKFQTAARAVSAVSKHTASHGKEQVFAKIAEKASASR